MTRAAMRWKAMGAAIVIGGISAGVPTTATAKPQAPRPQRTVLENGLTLLVIEQPHLPMIVVSAVVDAGSRFDAAGKEGVASLTATLLTEGTKKRTAAEIHEATDFLGARLASGAGDDYASVSHTVLKKDFRTGIDLFADVLLNPAFGDDDVARKLEESLAEIEADEQNPGSVADREFRRALYGKGPYRNPPIGWKDSLAKLGPKDVRGFYERAYRPDRTIIVASGDITMAEMSSLATELFGGWRRAGDAMAPPEGVSPGEATILRVDREITQANVVWGHVGTVRSNPDWYAISIMNYILGGGGFSSRMMASIRTDAGLAYSVFSYFIPGKLAGPFQVTLQTKAATTTEAITRVEKEVERIRAEPVSDEELSAAKKFLTGSFPLRFDSNGEMVGFFSQVEYYGLGLDYPERYDDLINSVTKDDVLRVAKKYLAPEKAILVVVGKQSEITLRESAPKN